MSREAGLRERTRQAVQDDLIAIALDLFLSRGYDETTSDAIAAAAGMSRRSFFRYFATKDDVLIQANRATGEQIAAELAVRPSGERPWTAMRRSFDPFIVKFQRADRSLPLTRLMLGSPALQDTRLRMTEAWQRLIAPVLETRLPADMADRSLHAHAVSGAALACVLAAQAAWAADDGRTEFGDLVDVAMTAVAPIGAATGERRSGSGGRVQPERHLDDERQVLPAASAGADGVIGPDEDR